MESLVIIRRKCLGRIKEAAYALGCKHCSVDFDYLTLDPQSQILQWNNLSSIDFWCYCHGNA